MGINDLIKYFAGESTDTERRDIGKWLEEDPSHREIFIKARIQYDALLLVEAPRSSIVSDTKKRFSYINFIGYAASILIMIGIFFLYEDYRTSALSTTYQTITVPAGSRTNIKLPDGSNVWINANTTLKYPLAFSKKERTILLSGEAYFDVVRSNIPFIVKTDKYDIEVLGTTFTVEAYPLKESFKTTLLSGKVKLYNSESTQQTFLNSGETAELINHKLVVHATKYANSYRWIDGVIYIEDKPFEEIMDLLEKFYDVDIRINNSKVMDFGYRGKLRISDGIDHALRVLQKDCKFRYEREENSNIIYIN